MPIKYVFSVEDELLKVTAHGRDDSFEEVMNYSRTIIEASRQHGCTKILCDERHLQHAITATDTYLLAENASQHASYFSKVAIICHKRSLKEGKFYETVASNRGLKILVTTDPTAALGWLDK